MKTYYEATSVEVLRPYVLRVSFADGTERDVDLACVFHGTVFEPLKDPEYFALVKLDPELGTVVWPNGADLAPEFLYHGGPEDSEERS